MDQGHSKSVERNEKGQVVAGSGAALGDTSPRRLGTGGGLKAQGADPAQARGAGHASRICWDSSAQLTPAHKVVVQHRRPFRGVVFGASEVDPPP